MGQERPRHPFRGGAPTGSVVSTKHIKGTNKHKKMKRKQNKMNQPVSLFAFATALHHGKRISLAELEHHTNITYTHTRRINYYKCIY